jgi:hypothetical protein
MKIKLSEIMPVKDLGQCRLHLAKENTSGHKPLNDYLEGLDTWRKWTEWRGENNRFKIGDLVFSFAHKHDEIEKDKRFIFGGIFKIVGEKPNLHHDHAYNVELIDLYKNFIGRLIITSDKSEDRTTVFLNKDYWDQCYVSEILREPYKNVIY